MSSLIEVLKQIQDELDLDSRTEARNRFDAMSKVFESEMQRAYLAGRNAINELAADKMMLAEYWMNQWVGSDPKWHGDWGKALRAAVREIKNSATERADLGSYADLVPGEDAAPGPVSGTVKIGRYSFDATKVGEHVSYLTRKGVNKTATDRIAKTFEAR